MKEWDEGVVVEGEGMSRKGNRVRGGKWRCATVVDMWLLGELPHLYPPAIGEWWRELRGVSISTQGSTPPILGVTPPLKAQHLH